MNCTSSKRPKEPCAKAPTPRGVIGCQAKGLFSACAFILDLEPQHNLEWLRRASTDCRLAAVAPKRRCGAPQRRPIGKACEPPALADCKSATRQTGSLRYGAASARMGAKCR